MLFVRAFLKRIVMGAAFAALEVFALLSRQKPGAPPQTVGILFINQGLGDLVMLSPGIQAIADTYSESKVTLITNLPPFIQFQNLVYCKPEEVKQSGESFDLLISPTLSLRHIPFILKAKSWVGYFTMPISESNVFRARAVYNLRMGHYLERGMSLLHILSPEKGREIRAAFDGNRLEYPSIIQDQAFQLPAFLEAGKYVVIAPISKNAARSEWPYACWAEMFERAKKHLENAGKRLPSLVVIGDSSEYDKERAKQLRGLFEERGLELHSLVGKLPLAGTTALISKSHSFLGVDSGPAHIAYQLAPRSAGIFIAVRSIDRLPHRKERSRIRAYDCVKGNDEKPLYSGLGDVPESKARELSKRIFPEEVATFFSSDQMSL